MELGKQYVINNNNKKIGRDSALHRVIHWGELASDVPEWRVYY
jgi:hypothetical protein